MVIQLRFGILAHVRQKVVIELLKFRYGSTNEKVIEQNNKIDSLIVTYYNLINKEKVIHIDFKKKKVI